MPRRLLLIFALGLALRVALMPAFGSSYATDLFLPFIRHFVENPGTNPWENAAPNQFPYGLPLLVIVSLPFHVQQLLGGWGPEWFQLALLKLPLLTFDLATLWALWRWLGRERHRALTWYWLNPIVIYICYLHAQLDMVTTSFTLMSVLLAMTGRLPPSALALGLAVGCKFHAILCLPVICAFIWNRQYPKVAAKTLAAYLGIFGIVTLAGIAPVIAAGNLGYNTVLNPEAMRLFAAKISIGESTTLYLGIAALVLVLGRLCISTRITELGLYYGCGLLLLLLLVLTDPMPGWYLWTVPFIASFFAMYRYVPRGLFFANQALYLIYFVGLPLLPRGLDVEHPRAIAFTLLQLSSVAILLYMWLLSVRDEMPLRFRLRPLAIGIAGDSGSGKDRLTRALGDLLGEAQTRSIEGDDYHKWERRHEAWERYTHLSPRANHLNTMALNILELMSGRAIFQPHYDHSTGKFTEPRRSESGRSLVVQGLHTLYLRSLRGHFDLRIFIAPDEDLRLAWKIKRDVLERGHKLENVRASFEKRRQDSRTFIAPQRRFADWIIEAFADGADPVEGMLRNETVRLGVRHVLWNDAPVDRLVEELNAVAPLLQTALLHDSDDPERLILEAKGEATAAEYGEVARRLEKHPRRVTRSYRDPRWRPGLDGLNQLVAFVLLQEIQR